MEIIRLRAVRNGKFLGADHGSWIIQESETRRGVNHVRHLNVIVDSFTDLLPSRAVGHGDTGLAIIDNPMTVRRFHTSRVVNDPNSECKSSLGFVKGTSETKCEALIHQTLQLAFRDVRGRRRREVRDAHGRDRTSSCHGIVVFACRWVIVVIGRHGIDEVVAWSSCVVLCYSVMIDMKHCSFFYMRLFNIHSCSLFELFLLGTTKPEQLEAQTRLKVVSHHLYLYRISTVEQISIATPGRDDFLDYI
jgi:hypothetical protein